MKNIINILKVGGLVLMAVLLLLTGCENMLGSPRARDIPTGKGSVQLSVEGAAPRTVFPDEMPDFTYDLLFTSDDFEDVEGTLDELGNLIELDIGTWSLDVEAKYEGVTVGTAHIADFEVEDGKATSLTIRIKPVGSEDGFLNWKITFSTDDTASALLSYGKISDALLTEIDLFDDADDSFDVENDEYTGQLDLEPGSYLVQIILVNEDNPLLKAVKSEIFHIYPELTTTLDWSFTEDDFVELAEDVIFTVTFDANGGTLVTGTPAALSVEKDIVLSLSEYEAERTGFIFMGWYDAADGAKDIIGLVSDDVTLKAKWGHTVTFDPDGGVLDVNTSETLEIESGQTLTLYMEGGWTYRGTLSGKIFRGWYLSTDETQAALTSIPVNENVTLMAKWQTGDYIVTLDLGEGGYFANPATAPEIETPVLHTPSGNNYTTPDQRPSRAGYVFVDWTRSDTDANVEAGLNIRITSNITLTANWTPGVLITFDLDDGEWHEWSAQHDLTFEHIPGENLYIGMFSTAVKVGSIFIGWIVLPDEDTLHAINDFPGPIVNTATTYTAKYGLGLTVTMDLMGGTWLDWYDDPIDLIYTVAPGEEFWNPSDSYGNPKMDGYLFDAWYYDDDCLDPVSWPITVTESITLYAGWVDSGGYEDFLGIWTGSAGTYILEFDEYDGFTGSYFSDTAMGPITWDPTSVDGKPASVDAGTLTVGVDEFTIQTIKMTPAFDAGVGGKHWLKDNFYISLDAWTTNGSAVLQFTDDEEVFIALSYVVDSDILYLLNDGGTDWDNWPLRFPGEVLLEIPIVGGEPDGFTEYDPDA